jgi:hypothetical protein
MVLDRHAVVVVADEQAGFRIEAYAEELDVAVAGEVLDVDDLDAAVG